jgi:drug/metabolite transporter (DMT)-like permease
VRKGEALLNPVQTVESRIDQAKGILITMLAAFLLALLPIWVRAVDSYSALSIAFFRSLFCSMTLAVIILRVPRYRARSNPTGHEKNTLWLLLLLGLSMCGSSAFYFMAILHTTVAKAVLLNYTAPIYVTLFAPLLLGERNSKKAWFAVILGFAGTALIVNPAELVGAHSSEWIGIVSGMVSGLSFSGVFLIGRFLKGQFPSIVRAFWGATIMMCVLFPWGISVPAELFLYNLPVLIGVGTVSMAIPFTLIYKAQEYVSAQVCSTAALFEPVCGVAFGYLIYGERLSVVGMIGAAAVLLGIYTASRS